MRVLNFEETLLRGIPLTRKRTPLGPYCRPMPRVLGGSHGGERFLMGEVPVQVSQALLEIKKTHCPRVIVGLPSPRSIGPPEGRFVC